LVRDSCSEVVLKNTEKICSLLDDIVKEETALLPWVYDNIRIGSYNEEVAK
jgi:hypothetical protein